MQKEKTEEKSGEIIAQSGNLEDGSPDRKGKKLPERYRKKPDGEKHRGDDASW